MTMRSGGSHRKKMATGRMMAAVECQMEVSRMSNGGRLNVKQTKSMTLFYFRDCLFVVKTDQFFIIV